MKKKIKKKNNRIAIITGSSGLIGNFVSQLFLNQNFTVYGLDVKEKKIKSNKFKFKKIDISNFDKTKNFISSLYKKHQQIDLVINNAAVSFKSSYLKRTPKELKDTININLLGVINIINSIAKNHDKKNVCKIINIGSIYGIRSPDFNIYDNINKTNSEIYGASKSGVIQLTKYYATALAKNNIIVNCISPGGLKDIKNQSKKFINSYSKKVPLKRMTELEDLKMAFLYFADKRTLYTTGQNLIIDGGFTIC